MHEIQKRHYIKNNALFRATTFGFKKTQRFTSLENYTFGVTEFLLASTTQKLIDWKDIVC